MILFSVVVAMLRCRDLRRNLRTLPPHYGIIARITLGYLAALEDRKALGKEANRRTGRDWPRDIPTGTHHHGDGVSATSRGGRAPAASLIGERLFSRR